VLAEGDELTIAEFPQIAARVEGFDIRIPAAPALAAAPALRTCCDALLGMQIFPVDVGIDHDPARMGILTI
jgi:hypothetical protein